MKIFVITTVFTILSIFSYAQQVPDSTGSAVSTGDAQKALDFHNKIRNDVGVSAMTWSPELAAFAQAWADHLAADNCAFEHRPNSGKWSTAYGENIFKGNGIVYTALDASKEWYDEIQKYTYGIVTNDNWSIAGHYTQMVWKNSTSLGIGVSTCSDGNYIIVANYSPAGNVMGQSPY